jgi:glutamate synthase domain-containing protein 2
MPESKAAVWECTVCGYIYDEKEEGVKWEDLPDDWECPVCAAEKSAFEPVEESTDDQSSAGDSAPAGAESRAEYLAQWKRSNDDVEIHMDDIHLIAASGESITEPMRSKLAVISWDDILIKGAQLSKIPLNKDEEVVTETIIGPNAAHPLVIDMPLYVSHMSFGALSREIKLALAKGSATVRTAMCTGEGGILPESMQSSYKYIFEYIPNRYSVTDENLKKVDAVEIKIGQSAKPGMGGHLPANKVTKEIADVRGFPEGTDITSPARFDDIRSKDDLKKKVRWLREKTEGKPIGIKLAAGHIEADLAVALYAEPDFITIDGKPGGTGASPKFVKRAASIPTVFALYQARQYLDEKGIRGVSLMITGGLRISSDFIKALALGADAIALGTAALMACGCQQYRICHTGKCPVGITTQDPELRKRLDVEESARRLANFLRVSNEELKDFARLTGNSDVHDLTADDLCTVNSEISNHTNIEHV